MWSILIKTIIAILIYINWKANMISKCIHFILDNLALILVLSFLGFILYQIILLFL